LKKGKWSAKEDYRQISKFPWAKYPSVPTRTLAKKLCRLGLEVSHMTVSRHLTTYGYKKSLPRATPMLTAAHKQKRIEWAQKHINDDWNKPYFRMKQPSNSSGTL
jgi:hypothetical protein